MARKPSLAEWPHTSVERVPLTAELMEGFVRVFLYDRLDSPKQTPPLHREIWEMFCSPHPHVVIAAPRGHAKSTAGTLAYTLASVLFGAQDFALVLGASERVASNHLKDIAMELEENEAIVSTFNVKLTTNNGTEVIGYCGGRAFCLVCKGSEQQVRGIKWRHKRPGLVMIDDLEEDEAVVNQERRLKLREWIDNAVLPMGSDNMLVRAVGTVLHFDSWLNRALEDAEGPTPTWKGKRFKAHEGFDDFSNILWPEKFHEIRLRAIRQRYINNNNPSGYSQEYLNQPIADIDTYFRRDDFRPMIEEDYTSNKNYYVGADFAISTNDRANRTSFIIGGIDPGNVLHIVDNHTGRWDSLQIIDKMFELQREWEPDGWFIEKGAIETAIMPILRMEMIRRGIYLNIQSMSCDKQDKMKRAQGIKARMRAGGVKFDKGSSWYTAMEVEMLQFPRSSSDDQVDAIAWLGIGCDFQQQALSTKELVELEWELEEAETAEDGRSEMTGY